MPKKFIDLSHVIEHGMLTYPGLPGPSISDQLSREESRSHYASGTEFHIGKIEMVANTGTYLDSPFHRYADGDDLADLALECLVDLEGVVVRADWREGRAVDVDAFAGKDLKDKAVLVHTGWDQVWGTSDYFSGHPYLTEAAANLLVEQRPRLVGIDSLNIDNTDGGYRPVHTLLLKHGILIVEHLTHLELLPGDGFHFSSIPVMIRGMGSFPVRAFATVEFK
jgi:arylformamidase